MKRYIAKTNVSINIVLASGANRHITFSSLTSGGSVFYTDDPEIEKAMESHYKFGKLFHIDHAYTHEKPRSKPEKKTPLPSPIAKETPKPVNESPSEPIPTDVSDTVSDTLPEAETIEDETEADESDVEDTEPQYKTIVVTDPDAAKAYLAEHFGISRTKLKKVETIKKVAAENGIVFQGI